MKSGKPHSLMTAGLAMAAAGALASNPDLLKGDELRNVPGVDGPISEYKLRRNVGHNPKCPTLIFSRMTPRTLTHFKSAGARREFEKRMCRQIETHFNLDEGSVTRDMVVFTEQNFSEIFGTAWPEVRKNALNKLTKQVPAFFGFTRASERSAKQIPDMKHHKREREIARRARQIANGQLQPGHYPTMAERAAA